VPFENIKGMLNLVGLFGGNGFIKAVLVMCLGIFIVGILTGVLLSFVYVTEPLAREYREKLDRLDDIANLTNVACFEVEGSPYQYVAVKLVEMKNYCTWSKNPADIALITNWSKVK